MPQTLRQWEDSLRQPALCELLPVRDYLDGCIIRTNGCFVAGYEASGLNTFFHADDTRNRTKEALEALVRSLPERSMSFSPSSCSNRWTASDMAGCVRSSFSAAREKLFSTATVRKTWRE